MDTTSDEECIFLASRCRRLQDAYARKAVDLDEFCYNIISILVYSSPACQMQCLGVLSDKLTEAVYQYSQDYLVGSDFKPSPDIFIAGPLTDSIVRQKQDELRPKYELLHDSIRQRVQGSAGA